MKTLKQKSAGGPRTIAGKQIVSGNAITHGVLSPAPLLPSENKEDWIALVDGARKSLSPQNDLELAEVDEYARLLWRERRLAKYETAACVYQTQCRAAAAKAPPPVPPSPSALLLALCGPLPVTPPGPPPSPEQLVDLAAIPDGKALDKILRYAAHLGRQKDRCLNRLIQLRALRGQRGRRAFVVMSVERKYETNSSHAALPAPGGIARPVTSGVTS